MSRNHRRANHTSGEVPSDFVIISGEGIPKAAQMLAPGRNRRRKGLSLARVTLDQLAGTSLSTANRRKASPLASGTVGKISGLPVFLEKRGRSADERRGQKGPSPDPKEMSDDQSWMLSFVCTRIGEQDDPDIVARMGHIVIHHRCRSRLVGGA